MCENDEPLLVASKADSPYFTWCLLRHALKNNCCTRVSFYCPQAWEDENEQACQEHQDVALQAISKQASVRTF